MNPSKDEKVIEVGNWAYGILAEHVVKVDRQDRKSVGFVLKADVSDVTLADFAAAVGQSVKTVANTVLSATDNKVNTGLHKRGSGAADAEAQIAKLRRSAGLLRTADAADAARELDAIADKLAEGLDDDKRTASAIRTVIGEDLWTKYTTV